MRPLPEQAVHLPFTSGPYRMAMDLLTVPEAEWFEIDACYPAEMAERRRLLAISRTEVFAALPVSDNARREALLLIVKALTTRHPAWFEQDDGTVRNHLTGEAWNSGSMDPLELAGRLVQDDLCLIQNDADGPVLTAACFVSPAAGDWRIRSANRWQRCTARCRSTPTVCPGRWTGLCGASSQGILRRG